MPIKVWQRQSSVVHIAERPIIAEHLGAIHWGITVLGKAAVLVPNDNGLEIAKLGGELGSHKERHRARAMNVDLFLAELARWINVDIGIDLVASVSTVPRIINDRISGVNNQTSVRIDIVLGRGGFGFAILKGDSNRKVRGERAVISLLADLDNEGIGNVAVLEEVTTTSTLAVATIFRAIDVELVAKRCVDALPAQAGA